MDSTVLQQAGNYPDDWIRTDFDHFATLQRGKDLTRDHFRTGSVPVAGSNGIIGYHDTANVRAPGVTVGRSGSVGKVTFYQQDFWAHNTALFVKDFHGNVPAFIAFFLDFLRLGRFGSGASVPTLDRNVFRTLPIVIPLPCEQRKIAAVLGLVQRAIEQQEPMIALTTELKKALLHKLFTEGLRGESQKQTEIGPVPESWEVKTVGDLFKFSSGKSRPKDTEPVASVSRPFPVYGGNGILGYSGAFLLEQPILLLGRVGEYCGCAHHTEGRAWISDNALYAKEILGEIDTRYAAEFFAYANLNQYSNRAGQPLITQGIISEVKVPLPSLDEQRAIMEPLTLLNRKLKHYETKRAVVAELFRTLLHHLMTAQIRVKDLDLQDIHGLNVD
jgi:type I restriction enzyme, S subunit